jgi:hypothetical protein
MYCAPCGASSAKAPSPATVKVWTAVRALLRHRNYREAATHALPRAVGGLGCAVSDAQSPPRPTESPPEQPVNTPPAVVPPSPPASLGASQPHSNWPASLRRLPPGQRGMHVPLQRILPRSGGETRHLPSAVAPFRGRRRPPGPTGCHPSPASDGPCRACRSRSCSWSQQMSDAGISVAPARHRRRCASRRRALCAHRPRGLQAQAWRK